ncbi:MAG: hypothetical protein ACREOZ_00720 [Gloeomargaritales cyanobacterium]
MYYVAQEDVATEDLGNRHRERNRQTRETMRDIDARDILTTVWNKTSIAGFLLMHHLINLGFLSPGI